jgi:hypothetical protein
VNWHFVVTQAVVLLLNVLDWNFLAAIDPLILHAQALEPRLADGRIDLTFRNDSDSARSLGLRLV